MTVMLVILWVFALLRCLLGWWWWHFGGQLLFDVRGFGWVWVGLGQLFGELGWAGSMKIDPRTTLVHRLTYCCSSVRLLLGQPIILALWQVSCQWAAA